MDLWIRSQDKDTLLKIDRLDVDNDAIMANFKAHYSGCDYIIIGRYINNKRALEVLDEIQKLLMPVTEYKQEVDNLIINYKNIDVAVYEMPKE